MKNFILLFILFIGSQIKVSATELYRVTLLRAEPGHLGALLSESQKLRQNKHGDLVIMRHSQGDQWDLMLLDPPGKSAATEMVFTTPVAFQHSFLASSATRWQQVRRKAEENQLYHIEMFHALAGKKKELIKQREMENVYYHATQRAGNVIFSTTFGSDVDSFTVGFYADLLAFATTPDLPEKTFEKAATDAGFVNRDSIGLYLRELISSHHDTLAVSVGSEADKKLP